jgi:meiosis-specific serine/threonine-protein kinase MEK1
MTLFDPTPPLQRAQKVCDVFISVPYYNILQRIGHYVVTSQCLGTGSFATVHLAIDPACHRQVACKSIRVKREFEVRQVMKEVRILMTLKHVSLSEPTARRSNLLLLSKPNINEIYDTEENERFMLVCSAIRSICDAQ